MLIYKIEVPPGEFHVAARCAAYATYVEGMMWTMHCVNCGHICGSEKAQASGVNPDAGGSLQEK